MKQIVISPREAGRRTDKYIMKTLPDSPKSLIYKYLRKKKIKLNGKRIEGSEILKEGDVLSFWLPDEALLSLSAKPAAKAQAPRFGVVYEDENIIVMNKPVGLLSQPDKAEGESLCGQLITYLAQKKEFDPGHDSGFVPAPVNRLDRNTGGLCFAGKTLRAAQELSRLFREDGAEKYYLALSKGVRPESFEKEILLTGAL
ncbi:MAG: RluA family pseudouridine synthase, partial [Firmicutes bacterium]|nr:RluA family pseudouridine synthase [Bacillota bacterium]